MTRTARRPGRARPAASDPPDHRRSEVGQWVGVPWLGHTCGYFLHQTENLCDHPLSTGFTRDGGFASATIVDARSALPLDEAGDAVQLAPRLCAGLIGWRSLRIAGDGARLGLYGFGAAAHILAAARDRAGPDHLRVRARG